MHSDASKPKPSSNNKIEAVNPQMIDMLNTVIDELKDDLHKEIFKKLMDLYIDSATNLKESQDEIKRLSITDPLTRVYNRMKLMDMLLYETKRYQRLPAGLCLIMIDIDQFKLINEQHGHKIGDAVLKEFCHFISPSVRKHDTFARWGGEEFVILMPGISAENALARAEELRSKISRHAFNNTIHITCSLGVSAFKIEDTVESFIKRTDMALTKSKESGKNKVSFGF